MIYFDNSATSRFKPQCMINTMCDALINSSNPGRGSHSDSIELATKIYGVREHIKSILGANNDYEVIFTKNTTEALNIAILGYLTQFKSRVHVITSMLEHNSVLRPLKYLASKGIIEVTILPISDGTISMSDVEMHIKNNTRLIVLNHTSNVIGTSIDLEYASNISTEYNIPLLLDTAQSLGHKRIDLGKTPVTMLAAAGHKGLQGPQGSGFLIVDKSKVRLYPRMYGGTGTNSDSLVMPIEYPDSFEVGTLSSANILGLDASMVWTYDNFDTINSHINALSNMIYSYLNGNKKVTLYSPSGTSVIAFNVNNYTSSEVADALSDRDIAVRSGLHCAPLVHSYYGTLEQGMVRISVGYNNTIHDVNMLIECLDEITK